MKVCDAKPIIRQELLDAGHVRACVRTQPFSMVSLLWLVCEEQSRVRVCPSRWCHCCGLFVKKNQSRAPFS